MSFFTPHINGELQPEKRSGHVSVFYQGKLFVYGGFGEDEHLPMKNKHIWVYNVEVSQWTRYTTKGDWPQMSTGATAAVIGNKMYLFGGFYQHRAQTNDLYMLNLQTFVWTDLTYTTTGVTPSGRDKFGFWTRFNKIIYFGGFGHPPENLLDLEGDFTYEDFATGNSHGYGWNNHLFSLDTLNIQWKQIKPTGDIPCSRAAFGTAQIKSKGYLFGGRYKDERRNDLYKLDLNTYEWTLINPKSQNNPVGRSWCSLTPVSDHHLLLYGGFDNTGCALKDVWLFDLKEIIWKELENASDPLGCFSNRLWHTSCSTDNLGEIVIFGGCSNSVIETERTYHTNVISMFRFRPKSLQRTCLDYVMEHSERYLPYTKYLPRTIQRDIEIRCQALGLNSESGLGRLVLNNCAIM